MMLFVFFFFFSSRRRHTRCSRDWSSDVCSSDLIVAGMVMLRWGIVATLIWHYTVDASLVGLFLIRSHSLYFKISGLVVAAAALARSEEHTSELQSRLHLVCRLLLEKKKTFREQIR